MSISILTFANIINKEIEITYYPNQAGINAHGDNVRLSTSVESSCQRSENPVPLGAGSSN